MLPSPQLILLRGKQTISTEHNPFTLQQTEDILILAFPADSGLNTAQFCLLRNLERMGCGNLTAWAEKTGIERTTMVRDAKILEARGFIEEVGGRGKVFTLSDKGRKTLSQAVPLWKSAQERVRAVLGEEDAAALLRIGQKLLQV